MEVLMQDINIPHHRGLHHGRVVWPVGEGHGEINPELEHVIDLLEDEPIIFEPHDHDSDIELVAINPNGYDHDIEIIAIDPNGEVTGDYASPVKYKPSELLQIPWQDRWKLNLEHRGLTDGELEAGRVKSARRITWLVEYGNDENTIFFFNQGERFGGPFGFLSNHHCCDFTVGREADGHRFSSMEQWYQYSKAECIALEAERFTTMWNGEKISSKALAAYILTLDNPNDCDRAGKAFNALESADPDWWKGWSKTWEDKKPRILKRGAFAKFDQNERLAQLLMMTGDFRLVKASERDFSCGIGFHASEARKNEMRWGENLLGQALEKTRRRMRAKYGVTTHEYPFEFWRRWEEDCNNDRYKSLMSKRSEDSGALPTAPPKFDEDFRRRDAHARRERDLREWKMDNMGLWGGLFMPH